MEIHQIKYFSLLARELHFGRASRKAHITQPTLSQQLKKLETELGAPLFERSPRKVTLTRAGERFLPYAVSVLDTLNRGAAELSRESGEVRGVLRLGAIPTVGPYVLPEAVAEIRRRAPQLRVELFEEKTEDLILKVREGALDIGLLSTPVSARGIVARALSKEPFYVAVSKQHPLAGRKFLRGRDIATQNLLILQEGHCFGDQVLDFCKRSREDQQVIFQGSSLTSVMRLAAANEGVTLVPAMAADRRMHPDLHFIACRNPHAQREIGLIWRVSAPLTPAHRFLMGLLEEILKARKP